jgi:hypothetical protein
MYIVYFFDNTTNKISVIDFGSSLDDAQKKLIYYGKEYIENENGKKHIDVCIKEINTDLNKEADGHYLIKNIEKIDLIKKSTKIDDVKGWTGTYQHVKSEIFNLGYYSFAEFDSKLLKQYSNQTFEEKINNNNKISEKKYEPSNNLVSALIESGFKPNKDCRFKFNITKKEQEIITQDNDLIDFPVIVGKITNNKIENDLHLSDVEDYPENIGDDIACVRSIIDDNFDDIDSIEDYSFSEERYDLLANVNKLNNILKIDKFYENSDSDYIDTDTEIDYDNSKETFIQEQLKEESLLYEPISRIEKKSIGKVTFIKKAWKCD